MIPHFIDEPELEFGGGNRHLDIRFGITAFGPLDLDSPQRPSKLNLGMIGTSETIEGATTWLEKCSNGVEGKQTRQPTMHPRFPGSTESTGLHSVIVTAPTATGTLTKAQIASVIRTTGEKARAEAAVELLFAEMQQLVENAPTIDVILCAVPLDLVNALDESEVETESSEETEDAEEPQTSRLVYDYRDMLKARMMALRKPIQIIRPGTYDESKLRQQKKRPDRVLTPQHEATRAWNIFTALYYKAGGTPWRIVRESSALTACYVGVSFYETFEGDALRTSIAQVFNERGEGVIVRGGAAKISKEDRQPHLAGDDAAALLTNALRRYREVHKTLPARVVVHKSSGFDADELAGFLHALDAEKIDQADLLSFGKSYIRLSRSGTYPPLRGTMVSLSDEHHILYTKGSVDFFRTWPGMHIPTPRAFKVAQAESTPRFLAQEIMSLTKMNWNNSQFDGSDPITLRAAREVSRVLRYCDDDVTPETRYSYYM